MNLNEINFQKYESSLNYKSIHDFISNTEYDQFLGIYKNSFNFDLCDQLIEKIHNPINEYSIDTNWGLFRNDFTVTYLLNNWSNQIFKDLKNYLSFCLWNYAQKYSSITQNYIATTAVKLQKTNIQGGFHNWHHETDKEIERIAVWMIYLNDLEQDDGTTEFIYQKRKITPTKGTCIIWPAGYTHSHRGNPPYYSEKYIATGWFIKVEENHPLREKFSI